jgi:hypothetical protein
MARALSDKLTRKEQFWHEHAQQAEQSGQSLIDYARTHALNVNAFYNARSVLRSKGVLSSGSKSSFVKAGVSVGRSNSNTVIVFPNGIRVETNCPSQALLALVEGLC